MNDQRERDLATERPAARHAPADEEVTAIDTEQTLEAAIAALENDTEQAIIEANQKLIRLRARLVDLKNRLAKFDPSNKYKMETEK